MAEGAIALERRASIRLEIVDGPHGRGSRLGRHRPHVQTNMNDRRCRHCGMSMILEGSLEGLCPACLLGAAVRTHDTATLLRGSRHRPLPFRLLTVLGQGPRGTTFLARDTSSTSRYVAVKILADRPDADRIVERFQRARATLSTLRHPSANRTVDIGLVDDDCAFVATEFVPGAPLSVALERPLGPTERLALVTQLCDVVEAAHQLGIVHLNLTASSVRVTVDDGRRLAKVLDFGLAALVDQATGSPQDDLRGLEGLLPAFEPRLPAGPFDGIADLKAAIGCLWKERGSSRPV